MAASILQGCVSVHAPLAPDESFPREWAEPVAAGPECKGVEGAYLNAGRVAAAGGNSEPVSLMSMLGFPIEAKTVSLTTRTHRVDRNGDAFITLRAAVNGDAGAVRERDGCFCIRQTLVCTQIDEKYWAIPNFGVGGSQSNVYLSISRDRALIGKLQNYHTDVVLGAPLFGMKEPWARFDHVGQ